MESKELIQKRKGIISKTKYPKEITKLAERCDVLLAKEKKIFWIDSENQTFIEDLFDYFYRKPEFEIGDRLLTKGLLIIGNVGSGKTMLFEQISKMFEPRSVNAYVCIECTELSIQWLNKDSELVRTAKYTLNLDGGLNHAYFDDLGDEEPIPNFGTIIEPMERIIKSRNIGWHKRGTKTHLSTNLSMNKIGERYGERTESRLRHMCNIMYLGAKAESKDRRVNWRN